MQLSERYGKNQEWALCYSTFHHPAEKPDDFHSRCDAYTGTISLGWNSNPVRALTRNSLFILAPRSRNQRPY